MMPPPIRIRRPPLVMTRPLRLILAASMGTPRPGVPRRWRLRRAKSGAPAHHRRSIADLHHHWWIAVTVHWRDEGAPQNREAARLGIEGPPSVIRAERWHELIWKPRGAARRGMQTETTDSVRVTGQRSPLAIARRDRIPAMRTGVVQKTGPEASRRMGRRLPSAVEYPAGVPPVSFVTRRAQQAPRRIWMRSIEEYASPIVVRQGGGGFRKTKFARWNPLPNSPGNGHSMPSEPEAVRVPRSRGRRTGSSFVRTMAEIRTPAVAPVFGMPRMRPAAVQTDSGSRRFPAITAAPRVWRKPQAAEASLPLAVQGQPAPLLVRADSRATHSVAPATASTAQPDMNRLMDEVMRRLDRHARLERQRRGY
jgi:hypothetical protein